MFKGSKRYETVGAFILTALVRAPLGAPCGWWHCPLHAGAAPSCPLSAGLQVLVREHVELTVHPTTFIPEQFCFALK